VSATRLVAYGKHLCGAASDLSLRCIASWVSGSKSAQFCGISIAVCCFHRCEWRSYVGKQWLRSFGFTKEDFAVLRTLPSWNVSGLPDADAEEAAAAAAALKEADSIAGAETLSAPERRRIGMMARHVLVAGRVQFLKKLGFEARVVTYCPEDISPENLLLLAVLRK